MRLRRQSGAGPRGLMGLMRPAAGTFIGNGFDATAFGTQAQVANRTIIAPFIPDRDLTIDQLGVSVSAFVASALLKGIVYASDAAGRPDAVLRESGNIDAGANATVVQGITPLLLVAGATYWVGVRSSSTATIRTLGVSATIPLAYTNAATPLMQAALIKTETFANAAGPWGYSAGQHSNALVPLVLMRVA